MVAISDAYCASFALLRQLRTSAAGQTTRPSTHRTAQSSRGTARSHFHPLTDQKCLTATTTIAAGVRALTEHSAAASSGLTTLETVRSDPSSQIVRREPEARA